MVRKRLCSIACALGACVRSRARFGLAAACEGAHAELGLVLALPVRRRPEDLGLQRVDVRVHLRDELRRLAALVEAQLLQVSDRAPQRDEVGGERAVLARRDVHDARRGESEPGGAREECVVELGGGLAAERAQVSDGARGEGRRREAALAQARPRALGVGLVARRRGEVVVADDHADVAVVRGKPERQGSPAHPGRPALAERGRLLARLLQVRVRVHADEREVALRPRGRAQEVQRGRALEGARRRAPRLGGRLPGRLGGRLPGSGRG